MNFKTCLSQFKICSHTQLSPVVCHCSNSRGLVDLRIACTCSLVNPVKRAIVTGTMAALKYLSSHKVTDPLFLYTYICTSKRTKQESWFLATARKKRGPLKKHRNKKSLEPHPFSTIFLYLYILPSLVATLTSSTAKNAVLALQAGLVREIESLLIWVIAGDLLLIEILVTATAPPTFLLPQVILIAIQYSSLISKVFPSIIFEVVN